MNEKPKILYRYVKVSLETLGRLGQIYLADPQKFNDPYDCLYHVIVNSGNELGGDKLIGLKKYLKYFEPFGCCCLSKVPHDICMWSHYADKHQGICIEYNTEKICNMEDLFEVDYKFEYANFNNMFGDLVGLMKTARINPSNGIHEKICRMLFAKKATFWVYEQEWRIVRYLSDPKTKQLISNGDIPEAARKRQIEPNEAINGIILGAKMSNHAKEVVTTYTQQKYPAISLKQAELSKEGYKIEIL